MNARILLISRFAQETLNLKRELGRIEHFDVDVASSPHQAIRMVRDQKVDLVVFNTEILTRKKLAMAEDLKSLGEDLQILILGDSVMADTLSEVESKDGTVFLEKPFDLKDFIGLTEKLIEKRKVRQRIFRRYETNQEGGFAKPPALNVVMKMKIRNLSQGGAYFEYDGQQMATVGENVVLDIPLNQLAKTYHMRAKVVWVTPQTVIGRIGVGVEFIR